MLQISMGPSSGLQAQQITQQMQCQQKPSQQNTHFDGIEEMHFPQDPSIISMTDQAMLATDSMSLKMMSSNSMQNGRMNGAQNIQPMTIGSGQLTTKSMGNYLVPEVELDDEYIDDTEPEPLGEEDESLLIANGARLRHNSLGEVYTIPEETEEDLLLFGTCVRGKTFFASFASFRVSRVRLTA